MNIIGEGFHTNIIEEIERRQKIQGYRSSTQTSLTPQVLDYLNSKTGWVRMISSVNVTSNELNSPSIKSLGLNGDGLAKEFILFNGVSSLSRSNKRGGIMGAEYVPNEDNINNVIAYNRAYGIGDTKNYGQSPMMGISSVNVKTETRGSLKTATIQIKAWNKLQFDIIDNLYLRLGFNVLLEWGHSHYFKSLNGGFSDLEQNRISLKNELFNNKYDYYGLLELAQNKRLQSYGNYDAMIGKVVNFNWTFNSDGSYDITVILRSQGDVIESLKTNVILDTSLPVGIAAAKPNDQYIPTKQAYQIGFSTPSDYINSKNLKAEKIDTSTELGKFYNECVNQVNVSSNTKAGCTVSPLNSESTTQDILKQVYQDNITSYYIRFGALLDFIQNRIIPKLKFNNNFLPILKFDTDIESNLIYTLGQTYSFSSKPNTCLVKSIIPLNNVEYSIAPNAEAFLDNIKKVTDSTPSNYQAGKLMNVYLNFDFLMDLFTPVSKDDGRIILIKFLQDICVEISNALGNVNSLNVTIDETTNKVVIIDQNSIPNRDQIIPLINPSASTRLAVFELFGYKNLDTENAIGTFIQDFSLKTSITPQFASMITVGATSQGYVVGEDATILSRINRGLTDRIKPEIVDANYNSFSATSSLDIVKTKFEENAISLINYIEQTFSKGNSLPKITSNLTPDIQSTLRNTIETGEAYNAISSSLSNSNVSSNRSGFIPFNLSLKMDGLSGMKVYQKFTVNNDYLPSNYPESLEFIVTSINHVIQDNKWITQIESLSLPKVTNQAKYPVIPLTTPKNISNTTVKQRGSIQTTESESTQFLIEVLRGLGITNPNVFQIQLMTVWRQHEDGQAAWNPFNTTLNLPGSTPYNDVPVRNYPNRSLGLQATVQTLKDNRYSDIITSLKNIQTPNDINKVINAINASPWGSKIYPADYTYYKTFNHLIWKEPLVNK